MDAHGVDAGKTEEDDEGVWPAEEGDIRARPRFVVHAS